jgi:hypothetical protein
MEWTNAFGKMRGLYFVKNGKMEGIPIDNVLIIYQTFPSSPLINNHHLSLFQNLTTLCFPKKQRRTGVSFQGCSLALEISLHSNQFIF